MFLAVLRGVHHRNTTLSHLAPCSHLIPTKFCGNFDGLYSQTVALFYNRKDLIYYGGQFKCYSNRQKNPDGDRVQEDTVRSLFITG